MQYLCLMLWLLAGWPVIAVGNSPAGMLHFSIAPQQSPRELAKRWGPIIQYLNDRSGVNLQFQTANSFLTYQQEMKAGSYDIAFTNAYYYPMLNKEVGYKVFVQEKDAKFLGIMVVRKDSPYQTVADLEGKQLAYPGPTTITAMLAHTHLKANKINYSANYVVSMDSVYRSVAKGLFAAGQGEMRTFGGVDQEIRDQLRILWTADPLPPFAFIVHPRVPQAVLQKIQQAMLAMGDDPEGLSLLKAVNITGFVAAYDSDYESVRKLKLLPLEPPP